MGSSAPDATKTVVVADDTAFVRDRFKTAIEAAGHQAVAVGTSSELLARIRADVKHIDLILLDLRLSNATGLDLVRAIRGVEGAATVPILVFSGTIASAEEVRRLEALGIAGYINEYTAAQHILPGLAPHLFPGVSNRRRGPRVVLGVPVTYRFGNTIAAGLTLNLSRGGLAIRTTSPLNQGVAVRVRFRLRGTPREIDVTATIAWSDRRVGMGLQFQTVNADDQRVIHDYVDRHFFTNRKA
jgi:uncharacterized protein (TIGR02266 family)